MLLRLLPQRLQFCIAMPGLIYEARRRRGPTAASSEHQRQQDGNSRSQAHGFCSALRKAIGTKSCTLHSARFYTGVTTSGIWPLVVGVVTRGEESSGGTNPSNECGGKKSERRSEVGGVELVQGL